MKEYENSNPLAGNCVGCAYSGQANSWVHCAYIFIVGQRRPCPPGDKCTVRKARRAAGRPGKRLYHNGQFRTVNEWAAIVGINTNTIKDRLRRGWSVAEALNPKLGDKGGGKDG